MKYTLTSFTLSVVEVRVRRYGLIIFHYFPVKTLRANTPLYLIVFIVIIIIRPIVIKLITLKN